MTVLANELITALMPPALIPGIVARGWWLSRGDDQWRSVVDDPDFGPLAGAYALPVAWRELVSPNESHSLRRDAVIVTSRKGEHPIHLEWLLDDPTVIPEWVLDNARWATDHPERGVEPYTVTMTELSRPFADGGPDLAYRMAQLDGTIDAVRNALES